MRAQKSQMQIAVTDRNRTSQSQITVENKFPIWESRLSQGSRESNLQLRFVIAMVIATCIMICNSPALIYKIFM